MVRVYFQANIEMQRATGASVHRVLELPRDRPTEAIIVMSAQPHRLHNHTV